jgi:hypothetical protein
VHHVEFRQMDQGLGWRRSGAVLPDGRAVGFSRILHVDYQVGGGADGGFNDQFLFSIWSQDLRSYGQRWSLE